MRMQPRIILLFVVAAASLFVKDAAAIGFRSFHFEGLPDPVTTRITRTPAVGYITQPLDHFNVRNNQTWIMRFYENDEFLPTNSTDAPILIMLGGEWEISQGWLTTGQMYNLASTHGAMLYYTEHRYYGQSYPTEDMSTENLQYLSVDQALADVAYFIEAKKKELNLENSKVVVFGGSYAGNMAAWARHKYPHLIQGAVASSAPVYAKADFYEYYEVVTRSLARYNPQCSVDVNTAFTSVEELLATDDGVATLTKYFNLCYDVDVSSTQDLGWFMNYLAEVFAGVVQYDKVTSSGNTNIGELCDIMTATYLGSPLQRLSYVLAGSTCMDATYKTAVELYTNVTWTSYAATSAMRPWFYQTCTEYGYYQTTNSNSSVFGTLFPITFFTEFCKDLYGEYYDENLLTDVVQRTNIMYGGWTPDVTNVIFSNGNIDPWHALSILTDVNDKTPAILVNGTSHCQDLYSDLATDSDEMLAAKARIREIVSEWLTS